MKSVRAALSLAAVGAFALAGCSSPTDTPAATTSGAPSAGASSAALTCTPASLKTQTPGKLTVGTDNPAYEPWFVDNKPANGKGYESAVAYAIAAKLGYQPSDVTWVTVTFDAAKAPGPKTFDIDLNQVSISEDRKKAVDFSSGYHDVRQTVITYKGSPIDGKTSIADLKGANLAAQVGTTSYTAIKDQIQPTTEIKVFDTNDLAVQALKNKQVDDLPTAFYMTAAQMDDGVIVGQLPTAGGTVEQFGAVLDKGSSLTPCVTKAVDDLRADATLTKLENEWLAKGGAPELKP